MTVLLRFALLIWLYLFLLMVLRMIHRDLRQLDNTKPEIELEPEMQALSSTPVFGRLKWREGSAEEEGKEFLLGEHTIIGRNSASHIVFPASHISGKHAVVWWEGNSFVILDLDSTNGTRVNGRLLTGPTRLRFGDLIEIGGVEMEFARCEDAGGGSNRYRTCPAEK